MEGNTLCELSEKLISRQSLGRSHFLGSLYNARTDEFVSGNAFMSSLEEQGFYEYPKWSLRYSTEKVTEKVVKDEFKKPDLDSQLKMSLLSGTLKLDGNGEYYNSDKKVSNSVRSNLQCSYQSGFQRVDFNKYRDNINKSLFETSEATHFVSGIYWGVNVNLILEPDDLHAKGNFKLNEKNNWVSEKSTLSIYSDVKFDVNKLPSNIENASKCLNEVLKNLPNEGKGIPIKYELTPLSAFNHPDIKAARFFNVIDYDFETNVQRIYHGYKNLKTKFNDLRLMLPDAHEIIPPLSFIEIDDILENLKKSEEKFRKKARNALIALRSEGKRNDKVIQEACNMEEELACLEKDLKNCTTQYEKICIPIREYKNKGVKVVHRNSNVSIAITKSETLKSFVLFWNEEKTEKYDENEELFSVLLETEDKALTSFFLVKPKANSSHNQMKKSVIRYYLKRKLVCDDFLKFNDFEKNFIRPKKDVRFPIVRKKPIITDKLKVSCPQSCSTSFLEWTCIKCLNPVYMDKGTENLHCKCYSCSLWDAEFRCGKSGEVGSSFSKMPHAQNKFYSFAEVYGDDPNYKEMVKTLLGTTMHDESIKAYIWTNGDMFISEKLSESLALGKLNGEGEYHWADGYTCKGVWQENKKHGEFILYGPSGEMLSGKWEDNFWCSKGKFTHTNGLNKELTSSKDAEEIKANPLYLKWLNMTFEKIERIKATSQNYEEKVNYVKSICRLGINGKYYCGKKRGKCECCPQNNTCGPSSGCNCKWCMMLDIQVRTLSEGFFVNQDGAVCYKTNSGEVYCGRSFSPQDQTGVPICDPNNGSCKKCKILKDQLKTIYKDINISSF